MATCKRLFKTNKSQFKYSKKIKLYKLKVKNRHWKPHKKNKG